MIGVFEIHKVSLSRWKDDKLRLANQNFLLRISVWMSANPRKGLVGSAHADPPFHKDPGEWIVTIGEMDHMGRGSTRVRGVQITQSCRAPRQRRRIWTPNARPSPVQGRACVADAGPAFNRRRPTVTLYRLIQSVLGPEENEMIMMMHYVIAPKTVNLS